MFLRLIVCRVIPNWAHFSRIQLNHRQPRAGRNGQYFTCLKFRSMRKDADAKQATRNDPRITKVGRVIRKLSIDEFP